MIKKIDAGIFFVILNFPKICSVFSNFKSTELKNSILIVYKKLLEILLSFQKHFFILQILFCRKLQFRKVKQRIRKK